ncbi:MAG: 3-dehydroquinate synthase [Alphaproteobacteria bacterium]|nr:3-dehydroquinate synthase [Alphaproteobacteria bacterium]
MNSTQTIPLTLERAAHHYDIVIGENLLAQAGDLIHAVTGPRRCVIITDNIVAPLFLQRLEAVLSAHDFQLLPSVIVESGEAAKSFSVLESLLAALFDRDVDRRTLLIALGGGVIGDLVGFAASVTLRGLDFVQVPTTLLAQVDSSVGGKTGINSDFGKNTIGAFYQPCLVLADVATLDSLPARHVLNGYAEVVKYGLIEDSAFFSWCEKHAALLLFGDTSARITAVHKSCLCKSSIVIKDEKESGVRALLNLGHSFAHALEKASGYSDRLLHGEAVAIGMVMAFDLSVAMGLCPAEDAARVLRHFEEIGLPVRPSAGDYTIEQLMTLMAHDKKALAGQLNLVLARGVGQAFVAKDVDAALVRAVWARFL